MLHLRCSVGQMVARGRGTDLALQHCSTPFPLCEMFRRLEKAFARLGIYLVYLWLLGLLSPKETRLFCLKKKKKSYIGTLTCSCNYLDGNCIFLKQCCRRGRNRWPGFPLIYTEEEKKRDLALYRLDYAKSTQSKGLWTFGWSFKMCETGPSWTPLSGSHGVFNGTTPSLVLSILGNGHLVVCHAGLPCALICLSHLRRLLPTGPRHWIRDECSHWALSCFLFSSCLSLFFLFGLLKIEKYHSCYLTMWAVLSFSLINLQLLEPELSRKVLPAPSSLSARSQRRAPTASSINTIQCRTTVRIGKYVLDSKLPQVTFSWVSPLVKLVSVWIPLTMFERHLKVIV